MSSMKEAFLFYIISITSICIALEYPYYPTLTVLDRNLIIKPGVFKNITIKAHDDNSYINVGNVDLTNLVVSAKDAIETMETIHSELTTSFKPTVERFREAITGKQGVLNRLSKLETRNTSLTYNQMTIIHLRIRATRLASRIKKLEDALLMNKCSSAPCKNGGTCINNFNKFLCICPNEWKGTNCSIDVNECEHFNGTDLGCQNNSTCENFPGGYRCICKNGWNGINCNARSLDCTSASNRELCGHGICKKNDIGINCICDQGWTTNGVTPACNTDINECKSTSYPCSTSPYVPCINIPGSFTCGFCPEGFNGDGFRCTDIDECAINNGGCSTTPLVQCINTLGSRICGPCPPGFIRNGEACEYRGVCSMNNGGCHSKAICTQSGTFVVCTCKTGYTGNGYGVDGCNPLNKINIISDNNSTGSSIQSGNCNMNPCVHGNCTNSVYGYYCTCKRGYNGRNCDIDSICSSQPCKNGGTCVRNDDTDFGYRCQCTAQYEGQTCNDRVQTCIHFMFNNNGTIAYNSTSSQNIVDCIYRIRTEQDKIVRITFEKFHLRTNDCFSHWLKIFDGGTSSDPLIGKYCDQMSPNNQTISSSGHLLYLWLRLQYPVKKGGFILHWTTTDPICGNTLVSPPQGIIKSPGFPGKYPSNRDCYWKISAPLTKRIEIRFFNFQIEAHPSCKSDYLEIYDGHLKKDPLLGKYCNATVPTSLISSGPNLLLYFHSNNIINDNGFQISYSDIEGVPGCGGVFTRDSGEITMLPSRERISLDCKYLIRIRQGNRLHIKYLHFDLQPSEDCDYDSLSIYNGETEESGLLRRDCGRKLPNPIHTSTNVALIVFKNHRPFASSSFRISYKKSCNVLFTERNGIIETPEYPTVYGDGLECSYLLILPPKSIIRLHFNDFDINDHDSKCNEDYLKIYDGDTSKTPLIGIFCNGFKIPPNDFVTSHNYLFMEFKTNDEKAGRGFQINYTSIELGCGGLLRKKTATISMLDHESNRNNCKWTIIVPSGYYFTVTWSLFEFENPSDSDNEYLAFYDNYTLSGNARQIIRYNGRSKPTTFSSLSNVLTVIYVSNQSVNNLEFSFSYNTIDEKFMCNRTFFTPSGYMDFYENRPPAPLLCTVIIRVPEGHQITLTVSRNHMMPYDLCPFEYIEIRDGEYEDSPLLGKHCGLTKIPVMISTTNAFYIKVLKSDMGMKPAPTTIVWNSAATGCGGTLTTWKGAIISPNFPQPYGKNIECYWKISVSNGNSIMISFDAFDLHGNCDTEYLEIFDSYDKEIRSLGKFCNNTNSIAPMVTISNQIFIKFRSDITGTGSGFFMNYITVCNRNITGFSGVIENPNYPNISPDGINCTWTITVPVGNNISFIFTDSKGSCGDIIIKIKDGDGNFTGVRDICHKTIPKYLSKINQVSLYFRTDLYTRYHGFRLEWIALGCGGILREPSGTFSAPDSSMPFHMETECLWTIILDPGYSIKINITHPSRSFTSACESFFLEIYDGIDVKSPVIYQSCYEKQNNTIITTSSSNYMHIKFLWNPKYSGKGIVASYTSTLSKCGGKFLTSHGLIKTPNYPKNYERNSHCIWEIDVSEGHRIEFEFEDFDLNTDENGTCLAEVKLYEGSEIDKNNLISNMLCGNSLNKTTYYSLSNKMLIEFISFPAETSKGFRARFSLVCGSTIKAETEGLINVDLLEISQHNHISCNWAIKSDNPGDKISLTFTDLRFLIEDEQFRCSNFKISIYNGESTSAPLLREICDNKAPPTIISDGNTITIGMENPSKKLHHNFEIAYSILSTTCGGNLKAEHGTITSPAYPSSYPPNINCVWSFNPSPGNKISLMFIKFDLYESENCETDYLELRDTDGTGKLLGIYCGNTIPTNFTINNSVWIKFQSNSDGTSPGFVIDYSYRHGDELTGPNGTIASPLYPNSYMMKSNGEFYWKINVKFNSIMRINFKEIQIPMSDMRCDESDSVTIYDGVNDESQTLLTACGNNIPESIESSSNVVYIVFRSSGKSLGSLFLLEWIEVAMTKNIFGSIPYSAPCGSKTITYLEPAQLYNLTSPGFPNGYDNNMNCEWIFETEMTHHLRFEILIMDLYESFGCYGDKIEVYRTKNHNDDDWFLAEKFCLNNSTGLSVDVGSRLKVRFSTDYFYNKTGFVAEITSQCGGNFTATDGLISPIYGNNTKYKIDGDKISIECEWSISVRVGRKIKLHLSFLKIQPNDTELCSDYIMFRNGETIDSPILGDPRYCGWSSADYFLETLGNRVFVKFKSLIQPDKTKPTFTFTFEEMSDLCDFELKLTDIQNSTTITSPNYPKFPNIFTQCKWLIRAPIGEKIKMDFVEKFNLVSSKNCEVEYIELHDGGNEKSKTIGKYCNYTMKSLKTTGNLLFIKYVTDAIDPGYGFKAVISIDVCGGKFYGSDGAINIPSNLPLINLDSDIECEWNIQVPSNRFADVTVQDLTLHNGSNCVDTYIQILEKSPLNETDIELSNKLCNISDKSMRFVSSQDTIKVKLIAKKGELCLSPKFILFFNSSSPYQRCFEDYVTPEGSISSPKYWAGKLNIIMCRWKISVPTGRRITLEVYDGLEMLKNNATILTIYNERHFQSRIPYNYTDGDNLIIESSSNNMDIFFYLNTSKVHYKQLQMRYTSNKPSLCLGFESDEGNFTKINTASPIYCKYEYKTDATDTMKVNNETLVIKFRNVSIGNNVNCYNAKIIVLGSNDLFESFCSKKNKDFHVLIPGTEASVEVKDDFGNSSFNIEYYRNKCGGIYTIVDDSFEIKPVVNRFGAVECAWTFLPPKGQKLNITFGKNFLMAGTCENEKLSYKTLFSNILCGNRLPVSLNFSASRITIQYEAKEIYNKTNFDIQITPYSGCGGVIMSSPISSPNFPSNYGNNQECTWKLLVFTGKRIMLTFEKRFALEQSPNCSKDYVEIFDSVKMDEWKSIAKLCGRENPPVFNSTGNSMKIVFRSDSAITSDGFYAKFSTFCGGVYEASEFPKTIRYNRLMENCEHHLKAPLGHFVTVNFSSLNLLPRNSHNKCDIENITLEAYKAEYSDVRIYRSESNPVYEVFCGKENIGIRSFLNGVVVKFSSQRFFLKPLYLEFYLSLCGGNITTSQQISSFPGKIRHSRENMICTWNITAPSDKIISLRFQKFVFESSMGCYSDFVEIFDGQEESDLYKLIRLCGNLTTTLPAIRSTTNKMIIKMNVANAAKYEGFVADVIFTLGESAGCGKVLHVNDTNPLEFKIGSNKLYKDFMDCHWLIETKQSHILRMKFKTFHLAPCYNKNKTIENADDCTCDFIEIRDGVGFYSPLLGRFCGHNIPNQIITSKNHFWIRFATDGTEISTGIEATISSELGICGETELNVTEGKNILISPGYSDGKVERNIRCTWNLNFFNVQYITIKIVDLDLMPPSNERICSDDRLEITGQKTYGRPGKEDAISGSMLKNKDNPIDYYGNFLYTYCGNMISDTFYYNYNKAMYITLKTSPNSNRTYRGFKIEYSGSKCPYNLTFNYGKIYMQNINDSCTTIIKVAENTTISIFFENAMVMDSFLLTIRDGLNNDSPVLASIKGFETPLPIYSKSNTLMLDLQKTNSSNTPWYMYSSLSAYYTSTSKKDGCGGIFKNSNGILYSPLFPLAYKKTAECEWLIETPYETKIIITFKVFDLGNEKTCEFNYVELIDHDDTVVVKYCPGDVPAPHEGSNNYMKIVQHSSPTNKGLGWSLEFRTGML